MLKIEDPRFSREPIVKMLTIKASLGRDDEASSVSSTNVWATLQDNHCDLKAKYPLTTIGMSLQMSIWS